MNGNNEANGAGNCQQRIVEHAYGNTTTKSRQGFLFYNKPLIVLVEKRSR